MLHLALSIFFLIIKQPPASFSSQVKEGLLNLMQGQLQCYPGGNSFSHPVLFLSSKLWKESFSEEKALLRHRRGAWALWRNGAWQREEAGSWLQIISFEGGEKNGAGQRTSDIFNFLKKTSRLNPKDLLLPYAHPAPQPLWELWGCRHVFSVKVLGYKRQRWCSSWCTETFDLTFTS